MHLLTLNAAGKPLAPARVLDPRRRRLSQVVGRHVDRSRPHMIAVQRARDPLQPLEEAWITRGLDRTGAVKPWPRRYLPADAVVVVAYLPRGGIAGGGARGRKSPLNIALGIAGLALVAFAGPIAGALLPSLVFGTTASTILQAGLVVGGIALSSLASRAKANRQATDTTQVFGVSGGGNLPKPGDRIPRGYGRSWMKPDLSQPDFSQYDGNNQVLLKRHTLGLGKYHVYAIRVGKQTLWTEAAGFVPPFNLGGTVNVVRSGRTITVPQDGTGPALEVLYGQASQLVPSDVLSASVGGLLPRPADNPSIAGPFPINQRGALVKRLQVDYQFPQGIGLTQTKKSGTVIANQPGPWSVLFEYAPIDGSGNVIGAWQTLYDGDSTRDGDAFSTKPLRYTRFKDVPAGRYAVRGRNRTADTSANSGAGSVSAINAAQWDGASGWVDDVAVRPGVTEIAMRIYANSGTQAAAFGELEVDAAAIIPVWNGSAWVEQETSKAVWAFLDVMRNADYGGAIPDDQLDLGTALGYAQRLTQFDTFDGTLRGPISVYEAASTVLLPMRAEPVHLGRYWSLVRDEPKSVRRHVIARRQIRKGTSQVTFDLDTAAGAGHVIGEFDQNGDYRNPNQVTAIYGDASLTPTRQRWTGVRDYAHAEHLTRWRAATGAYRRQAAPFGVEMEGRIYKRGDSISVDPWFLDVRKVAGVVENRGDALTLDADVPLAAGDYAVLRDRSGREWGPVALAGQGTSAREIRLDATARAGLETASGLTLAQCLSDGRRDMTVVLVGALAVLQENYLIQAVRPDGVTHAQVEALIDDPRVWAAIGASPSAPPAGYGGITDPESPSIVSLTAKAVPIAAGYQLEYAIQPGRGAKTFEVGITYDGTRYDDRAAPQSGSLPLNPVSATTITVRARAFGPGGLPGAYAYMPVSLGESTVNANLPPIDFVGLNADVQARIAHILDVEAYAQGVSVKATSDFLAVSARTEAVSAQAAADFQAALAKALQGIDLGNANAAAIISEASTRSGADGALGTRIDGVLSVANGNTAAILTESTTRANADGALSVRVDGVYASAAANTAAIVSEQTARANADGAQASRTDALIVQTDRDRAYFLSEQQTRIAQDAALTSYSFALSARVDTNTASIASESSARADADGALSTRIDGVYATANGNTAAIVSEQTARANADGALSTRIDTVTATAATNAANITSEIQARAGADGALGTRIDGVVATSSANSSAITSEIQARTDADTALGSRVDSVLAVANGNTAAIQNEATARANGDSANASLIQTVSARTDAGTANGQFSLVVGSAPSGVQARIQALLSTTRGGQTYGAGYYLDLMNDGTSRFVIDANRFYITANNSTAPAFSFDGQTLTIPNLQVTGTAIIPGAVNVPYRMAITSQTVVAQNPTNTNYAASGVVPSMSYTFTTDRTTALFIGVYAVTRLTILGGTQNSSSLGQFDLSVYVDGQNVSQDASQNNFTKNGAAAVASPATNDVSGSGSYFTLVGSGSHTVEIRYNFTANRQGTHGDILGLKLDTLFTKG